MIARILLGFILAATAPIPLPAGPTRVPTQQAPEDLDSELRSRQSALARAFNEGDVATVLSQYDPSIIVVSGSQTRDFAGQKRFIETAMAKQDRGRLRLEINYVRALGKNYALARGRFHLSSNDGHSDSALFTVIYRRANRDWKIIYAHSS